MDISTLIKTYIIVHLNEIFHKHKQYGVPNEKSMDARRLQFYSNLFQKAEASCVLICTTRVLQGEPSLRVRDVLDNL